MSRQYPGCFLPSRSGKTETFAVEKGGGTPGTKIHVKKEILERIKEERERE